MTADIGKFIGGKLSGLDKFKINKLIGALASTSPTDTDTLPEGVINFYYTEARFDSSFALKDTDVLTEGATNFYYTEARFNSSLATKTTLDLLDDVDHRYVTDAELAVLALTSGTNTGDQDVFDTINVPGDSIVAIGEDYFTFVNGANISISGNSVTHEITITAAGDVVGPAVAVDGNLVVFDGTDGKILRDDGLHLTNSIHVGTIAPVGPDVNDLWVDTN